MAQNKSIISSKFPYLPASIAVKGIKHDCVSLLDTGFDGDIALPASVVTNGESPKRFIICKLADNSIVEVPSYIGSITLGGKILKDVVVIIMGNEPIIGRGIISHFNIVLDHGKRVIVGSS